MTVAFRVRSILHEGAMSDKITVSPDDLLAMLAYRAQQIVAACGNRAGGSSFPDPELLGNLIHEMVTISSHIDTALRPIEDAA